MTTMMEDDTTITKNNTNNNPINKLYNSTERLLLKNEYYIIRHGQSLANVQQLIASNPDVACYQYGLSDIGQEQVREQGVPALINAYHKNNNNASLLPLNGILFVSSDLLRAKETATILRDGIIEYNNNKEEGTTTTAIPIINNDNEIIFETKLRERWFGNYDLTSDDNYNKVWEKDAIDSSHTIENVESVDSVMLRTTQLILELEEQYQQTVIVLVAHGDVLQILQTAFLKQPGTKHRIVVQHLPTATLRKLSF